MTALSEIFVRIRGDASQMGRDLENAHTKGTLSAERMQQAFVGKLGAMLGVWQGLRMGATSLESGLKQIEALDIIDEGKAKDSLQALLAIHEAQRDIIRDIPLVGNLGAALLASASGDKDIKKAIGQLDAVGGGAAALSAAQTKRVAMQIKALQASGAPPEQVAALATAQVDSQLRAEMDSEREKARVSDELGNELFAKAAKLRSSLKAQYAEKYGGDGIGNFVMRAVNPVVNWEGRQKLVEAQALESAGLQANVEYVAHRRAAREIGEARQYAAMANAAMSTAAGGALPGAVPQLETTNVLLQQLINAVTDPARGRIY
jgi:hypothetical protein